MCKTRQTSSIKRTACDLVLWFQSVLSFTNPDKYTNQIQPPIQRYYSQLCNKMTSLLSEPSVGNITLERDVMLVGRWTISCGTSRGARDLSYPEYLTFGILPYRITPFPLTSALYVVRHWTAHALRR